MQAKTMQVQIAKHTNTEGQCAAEPKIEASEYA
jgi:hypothetical protein